MKAKIFVLFVLGLSLNSFVFADDDIPWLSSTLESSPPPDDRYISDKQAEWAETSFKWTDLSELLTPNHCYISEKTLYFCLASISAAVNILDNDPTSYLIFETEKLREIYQRENGTILKAWKNFRLVRYKGERPPTITQESIADGKDRYNRSKSVLISVWADGIENESDFFGSAISYIDETFLKKFPERESWAVGAAISEVQPASNDAHARYITPKQMRRELGDGLEEEELFGLTIFKLNPDSKLFVRKIESGGASERAGLRVGDEIISINGRSVNHASLVSITDWLGNNNLKTILLKIKRADHRLTLSVTREPLAAAAYKVSAVPVEKGAVIHAQIFRFSDNICFDFWGKYSKQVEKLKSQNIAQKGLVLDLRNNGGGLAQQAACLLGLFLGENEKVLDLIDYQNNKVTFSLETKLRPHGIRGSSRIEGPVVVLVDPFSASASELVTGNLQISSSTEVRSPIYHRVLVVGTPTFGKGSVQETVPSNKGGFFSKTVGYYRMRSNIFVQGHGIIPDLERFFMPTMTDDQKYIPREEDLFVDPLPRRGLPLQVPDSWMAFKSNINTCIKVRGELAETKFRDHPEVVDYMLESSLEALQCMPS